MQGNIQIFFRDFLNFISPLLFLVVVVSSLGETYGDEFGSSSGLPIPRYVSLKSDEVNLRSGPGKEYPTQWVYRRVGLPVEVLKEFEGWRQVRDSEGATGWVNQSLLSGRRTALILPWEIQQGKASATIALKQSNSDNARTSAIVEAGVIANIQSCDGRWCYIIIDKYKGYIEQKKLWGIYEGETIR